MRAVLEVYFVTERVHISSADGKTYRLEQPMLVTLEGKMLAVPQGFETDLDSVPRLPLSYALVKGRAFKSAILHDYLYHVGYPREFADDVMFGGMVAEEVHPAARTAIYAGVRAGGWKAYNGHREREAKVKRLELMDVPTGKD
jgi:hypothetical protein